MIRACPKPRPHGLVKDEAKAQVRTTDRAENAKVKARSGWQCEVRWRAMGTINTPQRCFRRADHIHHLMGGIGRRNVGASLLASHKLHVCRRDHSAIHLHILQPVGPDREDAARVVYERQR